MDRRQASGIVEGLCVTVPSRGDTVAETPSPLLKGSSWFESQAR